jgi:hypothetical protein
MRFPPAFAPRVAAPHGNVALAERFQHRAMISLVAPP